MKKTIFSLYINIFLFFLIIIVTQNSNEKNSVNFIFNQTIELPNSFILGTSFVTGSLLGSLIDFNNRRRKKG